MSPDSKKLIPYILVIASLIAGIFLGREVFKKRIKTTKISEPSTPIADQNYRMLNPFLDCIESRGLRMEELEVFKPAVNAYINKAVSKHPDLHISYYFRDLNNGLWIGVNEKEVFSPASLMKVPIMISVLKEAQKNPLTLPTQIKYEQKVIGEYDEESGYKKEEGTFYTVEEYMRQMIVYSDNASAAVLMKFLGMDKIVQTEKDLNLSVDENATINTNFVPVNRYSSVFRILFNASYLNKEMSDKALKLLSQTEYKGGIRSAVPQQYTVSHKYGERDEFDTKGNRHTLQLHHFGIIYYPGKPFMLGIMTRGADKKVKEQIIYDLAKISFDEVNRQMK